jgi:hypothetical protein
VEPHSKDVDKYGASMPLNLVDIFNPKIPSSSANTGQELHPCMECDLPTPPKWVVDSLSSHDILYFEFPLKENG